MARRSSNQYFIPKVPALLDNNLATSTIGRGALSGAVGGSVGAGTSAALSGGDVASAALQGGLAGAAAGAAQSGIISGAKKVGDNLYSKTINKDAVTRLANGIEQGADGNIKFARMTEGVFNDINNIRAQNGLEPLTQRQVTAYQNAVNNNLGNRVNEGLSAKDVAQIAYNSLTSSNAAAIPGYYENQVAISSPGLKNDYDTSVIGLAQDGGTSLKSIEPRTQNQVSLFTAQGQQKIGPKTNSGFSLADGSQPTSNSTVSQNSKNVNPNLMYGESQLGNRTKRGTVAEGLSRLGNTLEGAQTNVTRAAARDLGIESTGKVIENVRKKTGLTNLETQASLAKELTGGENSLMDRVQRQALSATEDGKPFKVDTSMP